MCVPVPDVRFSPARRFIVESDLLDLPFLVRLKHIAFTQCAWTASDACCNYASLDTVPVPHKRAASFGIKEVIRVRDALGPDERGQPNYALRAHQHSPALGRLSTRHMGGERLPFVMKLRD
jgi:hypothetical protein